MFAAVQQMQIRNRSCYHAAKHKIFRRENTIQPVYQILEAQTPDMNEYRRRKDRLE
jgi:hypothetical protein